MKIIIAAVLIMGLTSACESSGPEQSQRVDNSLRIIQIADTDICLVLVSAQGVSNAKALAMQKISCKEVKGVYKTVVTPGK